MQLNKFLYAIKDVVSQEFKQQKLKYIYQEF